jgi:hypothetical protein
MKKYLFKQLVLLGVLAISLFSQVVNAVEIPVVQGRFYQDACGYFSSTIADLKISYVGSLEPGARVFIKYSSLGYNMHYYNNELVKTPFGWEHPIETEMTATGPGVRSINIISTTRERSPNFVVEKIGFVFHIIMPNGEYWNNGYQSTWGSYEVDLKSTNIPCWNEYDPNPAPTFQDLPILIHNK